MNITLTCLSCSYVALTAPIPRPTSSANSFYDRWFLIEIGANEFLGSVGEDIRILLTWRMVTDNSNIAAGLLLLAWWLVGMVIAMDKNCP